MSSTSRTAPASLQPMIRRLKTEAGRQTTLLYGAQLASSALNFLFLTSLARSLGRGHYGVYSFCLVSVVTFVGSLFDFGIFPAGARLLAVTTDRPRERRVLGALLLAALGVGALLALAVFLLAPWVDRIYHTDVAWILRAAAPFAMAVPLQVMAELACQGTNRIGALAAQRVTLPVVGMGAVGLLYFTGKLSPWTAVLASLCGALASVGVVVAMLRPAFGAVAELKELLAATRDFGFSMYLGRCVGMVSARLDAVLIPFFIGQELFGVYNVAQRVSEPVSTLARSIAMTRFKAFAGRTHVSGYILRWNAALMAFAVAGLAVAGPIAVTLFFGQKWYPVRPLIIPFAGVALFAGLMQPYNMFLTAHGKGRELRNISLALGLVNLVGLLFVVKPFGLMGAAVWAVGAMAFNFVLNLYYYRRVRKDLENKENEQHDGSGV